MFKIFEQRSDDTKRGTYDILGTLAAEIGKALAINYTDYDGLDEALRNGTKPPVVGRRYDLTPHLIAERKIPEEAVSYLRPYVEDGNDIDHIILAGGSAFFFRDAIRAAFPHQHFGIQKAAQALRPSATDATPVAA